MASCSCSHWWHALFYCSLGLILSLLAITSPPPPSTTTTTTTLSPLTTLTLNATTIATLRHHNFSISATLLSLSPSLFSPSLSSSNSTPTTIFALSDDAVSNLSSTTPPWALKLLLQYHSLPHSSLSLQRLLQFPQNSCLPSSLPFKNLALTKIDPKNSQIEINGVPISHPDLFLDDSLSIHGVLAPFTPLNRAKIQSGRDFIDPPPCNLFNLTQLNSTRTRPEYAMWVRVIRVLSSNGFVSFAIGLNSVLDGVLEDYPDLGRVTVFAPPDFGFVGSSDPFLDRVVRYHVLPKRYSFSELASLPEKAVLRTLLDGEVLEVTESVNGSQVLAINGVEVALPDVLSSEKFVVHGIARAFEFSDHANS